MRPNQVVFIETHIIPTLVEYVKDHKIPKLTIITDDIEYRVLGRDVEEALVKAGLNVSKIVLTGKFIAADADFILKILLHEIGVDTTYVAVGSGVVTDITRFAAAVTRMPYLSVPTATSVDAYASGGSALTVERTKKQAESGRLPEAIFADLKTLCEAPHDMIASGIGDIIAKFNSVTDWRLANLVMGEKFNPEIAQRSHNTAKECARISSDLKKDWEGSIRMMFEALVESGLCMVENGNSQPASGTEHHISHFWEMRLLMEDRPPVFHGHKVGIGTIYAARFWEKVRGLTAAQAAELAAKTPAPKRAEMEAQIHTAYGPAAPIVLPIISPWLEMDEAAYTAVKQRIVDYWDKVQEIAAGMPSPAEVKGWLLNVGGPTRASELNLTEKDRRDAISNAHYIRRTFTVQKLCWLLGIKLDDDPQYD
jgi:glycerol-1-phosphate dehydrogenase [NAD(P)+]